MHTKPWGMPAVNEAARWEFQANEAGETSLKDMFNALTSPWMRARYAFSYSWEASTLSGSLGTMVHVVTITKK